MSESQNAQLSKYLRIARKCLLSSRYDEALAHFVCLGKIQPSLKAEIEDDFMLALSKCSERLEQVGEYRKIVACFQEAASLFPYNESLLNNIGGTLFRLGFPDESASMFRKALQLNPDNIHARQSLENISNTLVERWHFRMLNDKDRNTAYKNAISKAVAMGYNTVLDIGSGSGILSMFAVQAGAKKVFACELSKTMFEVSQDVLKANNMEDNVILVNKKSTEMIVGRDIPSKVNLVVTETMDCGLFGEGILNTISHAWEHLLVSSKESSKQPISRVIPRGAKLYGKAIMAQDIRTQSRSKVMISDINMASVNIIGGDQLDPVGDPFGLVVDPIEPYTTDSLNLLHNGYTALSDPFIITEYDFCDPEGLGDTRRLNFEIPVIKSGSLDAVAVWFDLQLDDEIHISTSPNDQSLCWEQAVFPVFPHHITNAQLRVVNNEALVLVHEGDILVLNGVVDKEILKVQCSNIIYHSIDTGIDTNKANEKTIVQHEGMNVSCTTESDFSSHKKQPNVFSNGYNNKCLAQYPETSSTYTDGSDTRVERSTPVPQEVDTDSSRTVESTLFSQNKPYDFNGHNNHSTQSVSCLVNIQDSENEVQRNTVQLPCENINVSFKSTADGNLCSLNEQSKILPDGLKNCFPKNLDAKWCSTVNSAYSARTKACQAVVPHCYMSRVNDTIYMDAFSRVIKASVEQSTVARNQYCEVIEHTLGLPVLALIAARCNKTRTLVTNPAIPSEIINQLAQDNDITGQLQCKPLKLEDIAYSGRHLDIFITDLVEPSGIIKHQGIEDVVFARGCLLKETSGIVIPRGIHAISMCIESDDLISLSKVQSKDHTLGLEIGSFMNGFKVSTQINVDMTTLNFKPLTEEFELFGVDFMSGNDDDLLSLLEHNIEVRVKISRPGVIQALPYWFNVVLDKKTSLSTYSCGYQGSHWKQAVYILDHGLQVDQGDEIVVYGTVKESCVTLDIRKVQ